MRSGMLFLDALVPYLISPNSHASAQHGVAQLPPASRSSHTKHTFLSRMMSHASALHTINTHSGCTFMCTDPTMHPLPLQSHALPRRQATSTRSQQWT